MSILEAFVELVKALVWPATILGILYMLRGAIDHLLRSINEGRVKYKDLEVIINRDLVAARESVAQLPNSENFNESPDEFDHPLVGIASISPRAAILEAWAQLEAIGAATLQKHIQKDELPRHLRSPVSFGEALRSRGLIPTPVITAIMKLRDIRNRTAHAIDYQPSFEDAKEFILLTLAVIADLENAQRTEQGAAANP
jgi:hypothetical protein